MSIETPIIKAMLRSIEGDAPDQDKRQVVKLAFGLLDYQKAMREMEWLERRVDTFLRRIEPFYRDGRTYGILI